MHLTLGDAHGKDAAGVKLYAERYPQCRLANKRTFHNIVCYVKETATIRPPGVDSRQN
jgi:hypothetical protein